MTVRRSVLVLNESALPAHGAGGTRHIGLFSRLANWDAKILAANRSYVDGSPVKSDGILRCVPVISSEGNGIRRVLRWLSFMTTSVFVGLRGDRPTVIWGSSPPMTAALAAFVLAKLRRTPFILEVRDLWPHILAESGMFAETSAIYRILKSLERFLYRRADAIVILAEGSASYIGAEGIDIDRLVFVPNGADPSHFERNECKRLARDAFEFDRFTIVYAGAHGPANGLDLVLDAAAELQHEVAVTFALVGNGSTKEQLQSDARARGLDNVRFLDPIAKSEIPRLFHAADAGLHCLADLELFKSGVSPNKLYDYMAAGLPVITNTSGEVAAMVNEAGAGIAVSSTDIAAAVRSLAALSPEERATLGAAGIDWMNKNRSPAAMAARIEDLLAKVTK